MKRPRQMPPFWYIRRGCAHWAGYVERRHEQHSELLNTLRGPLRQPEPYRLQRKNRQSARAHAKIFDWLLKHHAARTGWVGYWDEHKQQLTEMRFQQIADGCGVHRETLKRELRKLRANGLIHRWQGRDYRPENKDQPWAGKVAVLRLTRRFFEISRCAEPRQRLLDRWKKRELRDERRQQPAEDPAAVAARNVAALARAHRCNVHQVEHFVRRARVQLGADASTFAVHRHADGLLEACARRRPPPTPRPAGEPTPAGTN